MSARRIGADLAAGVLTLGLAASVCRAGLFEDWKDFIDWAQIGERTEAVAAHIPFHPLTSPAKKQAVGALFRELGCVKGRYKKPDDIKKFFERDVTLDGKTESRLPTAVPWKYFAAKENPWQVFLMKHRREHPAAFASTTPKGLLAGDVSVQAYVELEGTVTHANASPSPDDGDLTFNIGALHLEIPPEQQRTVGYRPKKGDTVRVRGWTFLDLPHFAGADASCWGACGKGRGCESVAWEIHPVISIKLVTPAPEKAQMSEAPAAAAPEAVPPEDE